ncbi:GxxExxY protein [Candidatus Dependentiae bacterium]|nr:GxxExxY protein [Candidatus Dependentiae bacterium]
MDLIFKDEYNDIMKACLEVKNELGIGFLEKVYENALKIELESMGYTVKQQHPISVLYKNNIVGEYFADLVINDKIIIELKCSKKISDIDKAQLIHYLKSTGIKLGVLINFNKETNHFEIERYVY